MIRLGFKLACSACLLQVEQPREVEVLSASGCFVAHVRKAAGQEQVPEPLARWRLSVLAIDRAGGRSDAWSCIVKPPATGHAFLLTDDGRAFVDLDPSFDAKRALVRVWRDERELAALNASNLGIERTSGEWLAPTLDTSVGWMETPVGPQAQLFLRLADDVHRRVDLSTGEVFASWTWSSELAVEPVIDERLRAVVTAPFVDRVTGPAHVHWGDVIEVTVAATHPTPNWRCVGFDARIGGEDGRTITLAPLSAPPPKDSVQAQVLTRFETKARIHGLAPGRYAIRVASRGDAQPDPLAVEVLPARALLELHMRGGFMGLDNTLRLFPSGVLVATKSRAALNPSFAVLDREARKAFESAFAQLSRQPRNTSSVGADMFEYTLRWTRDGKELAWSFDDGSADANGRELVRILREAAVSDVK